MEAAAGCGLRCRVVGSSEPACCTPSHAWTGCGCICVQPGRWSGVECCRPGAAGKRSASQWGHSLLWLQLCCVHDREGTAGQETSRSAGGFKLGPSRVPPPGCACIQVCSTDILAQQSPRCALRPQGCAIIHAAMGWGGLAPQSSRPAVRIVARWTAGGCCAARGGRKLAAMAQAATFTPFRSSSFAGQRVVAKSSSVARSAVLRQPVQCRTLEAGAWPRPMLQGCGLPAAARSP